MRRGMRGRRACALRAQCPREAGRQEHSVARYASPRRVVREFAKRARVARTAPTRGQRPVFVPELVDVDLIVPLDVPIAALRDSEHDQYLLERALGRQAIQLICVVDPPVLREDLGVLPVSECGFTKASSHGSAVYLAACKSMWTVAPRTADQTGHIIGQYRTSRLLRARIPRSGIHDLLRPSVPLASVRTTTRGYGAACSGGRPTSCQATVDAGPGDT
jgi:hypothetical protein